jgi:hypothetical protein
MIAEEIEVLLVEDNPSDQDVNSYIQKPVDFDRFRDTIRQVGLYWLVVNRLAPSNAFATK